MVSLSEGLNSRILPDQPGNSEETKAGLWGVALALRSCTPARSQGIPSSSAPDSCLGLWSLPSGGRERAATGGLWMEGNDPTQNSSLRRSLFQKGLQSLGPKRGVCAELCFLLARIQKCLQGNRRDETRVPLRACTWESCLGTTRGFRALQTQAIFKPLFSAAGRKRPGTGVSAKGATLRGACTPQRGRVKPGAARPLIA